MKYIFSKKFLPVIVIITVVLLFAYYIYNNISRLHYLFNFSPSSLLLIIALSIIIIFSRGITNCIIYSLFSLRLSIIEGAGVAIINNLGNLLPFSGGLFAKGIYLKKRHNLAFGHYFPATATLLVTFLGINGLMGMLSLAYLTHGFQEHTPSILLITFGLMLFGILTLWIPFPTTIFPSKWQELLKNIKEGWQGLGKDKTTFLLICLLQIISVSALAARLYLIFQMFSLGVGYLHCLLFTAATIITRFVTIAPGGIGAREAIVGGIAHLLGLQFGISALVVMVDRIFAILVCFLLAFIYSLLGMQLLGIKNHG